MKKQVTNKATETTTETKATVTVEKAATKAETKAREVAERKAATEAKKAARAAAENIGSALSAAEKLTKAAELKNLSSMGKAVLAAYMAGNSKAVGKSAIVDAGGRCDGVVNDVDNYKAAILGLYVAATNEADKHTAETSEALFSAWKSYLKGLITDGKLPASGQDGHRLYKAVTDSKTEGTAYKIHTKKDGTKVARLDKGTRHEAVVSLTRFAREAERLAAERLADLDGVLSYNAAKAASKNNKELKDAALEAAKPVQIVKKAS